MLTTFAALQVHTRHRAAFIISGICLISSTGLLVGWTRLNCSSERLQQFRVLKAAAASALSVENNLN